MAGLPLQSGEETKGFEFQVEHHLQSESQQLAGELERLLASERDWPGCLGTVGPDLIDATAPNCYITRTHWKDEAVSFAGW